MEIVYGLSGGRRFHILLFIGMTILQGGCPQSPRPATTTALPKIVTTTGMVTEMVREIVGEHAQVQGLMGEGIDPHLFRPTATDVGKMMEADMVIYSGLMLEGQMQQAFELFQRRGKTAFAITDAIPPDKRRFPAGFESHPDPHIWNDAVSWSTCIGPLVTLLSDRYPEHAAEFQLNGERYRQQLLKIDDYVRKVISTIPRGQRHLITAHDAFGYFSETYDIPVRSVQGITTESDPGVADINELVNFLVENKVPALFVEATVNQSNIRAVLEGARQQGWNVRVGGTLYSDSMGAPGTYEGTYVGMLDHNATIITQALGGDAPRRGMNGQLTLDVVK